MAAETPALLEAKGLSRHFRADRSLRAKRFLHAVDDVDLAINAGEIIAVVGESGSGKSTLARLLGLMLKPTRGEILFEGRPVQGLHTLRELRPYRHSVQLVFQDPFSIAHPVYRASHGLMRALKLHAPELNKAGREAEARRLLEEVGLTPAEELLEKRPFELSGGQLQRFGFAQALACRPQVILADEPVSMLDVSIRIGLLNLMDELRKRENVAILYITHDLASACYLADRVVVMYAGHIVETATIETLLSGAKHPYTQLLLSAVPDPRAPIGEEVEQRDRLEPPRVIDPAPGCRFRDRCPLAVAECAVRTPRLRSMGTQHEAACHVAVPDGAATSAPVPTEIRNSE